MYFDADQESCQIDRSDKSRSGSLMDRYEIAIPKSIEKYSRYNRYQNPATN